METCNSKKCKAGEVAGGLPDARPTLTKRQHLDPSDLIAFFGQHVDARRTQKPARARPEASLRRLLRSKDTRLQPRTQHSMGTQALVIFLRFQSLQTDARPWLAPTEVYRRTGVKLTSQWRIIQRWRSNGFLILRNQRPGQPRMLTAEQPPGTPARRRCRPRATSTSRGAPSRSGSATASPSSAGRPSCSTTGASRSATSGPDTAYGKAWPRTAA